MKRYLESVSAEMGMGGEISEDVRLEAARRLVGPAVTRPLGLPLDRWMVREQFIRENVPTAILGAVLMAVAAWTLYTAGSRLVSWAIEHLGD